MLKFLNLVRNKLSRNNYRLYYTIITKPNKQHFPLSINIIIKHIIFQNALAKLPFNPVYRSRVYPFVSDPFTCLSMCQEKNLESHSSFTLSVDVGIIHKIFSTNSNILSKHCSKDSQLQGSFTHTNIKPLYTSDTHIQTHTQRNVNFLRV